VSPVHGGVTPAEGRTPGQLLRQAREAAGLDLDTLASNVRVAPRKLQLLEDDRPQDLPDPAFARALALTVCRALHIDPAPVLAGLPRAEHGQRLEELNQGLNQPFGPRRRWLSGTTGVAGLSRAGLPPQAAALAASLLLAALAVYLWPQLQPRWSAWMGARSAGAGTAAAADAAASLPSGASSSASAADPATVSAPAAAASATVQPAAATVTSAAIEPRIAAMPATDAASALPGATSGAMPGAAAQPGAAPMQTGREPSAAAVPPVAAEGLKSASDASAQASAPLVLQTSDRSWVDVRDANGRTVLSRMLAAGESVALAGAGPWRVKIGNAGATRLTLRGQAVDLAPYTRNNVARVDLQ